MSGNLPISKMTAVKTYVLYILWILAVFWIFAVSLQIILCLVGNFVTVICASEVGNSKISTILLDITWQWKQLSLQPPNILLGPPQFRNRCTIVCSFSSYQLCIGWEYVFNYNNIFHIVVNLSCSVTGFHFHSLSSTFFWSVILTALWWTNHLRLQPVTTLFCLQRGLNDIGWDLTWPRSVNQLPCNLYKCQHGLLPRLTPCHFRTSDSSAASQKGSCNLNQRHCNDVIQSKPPPVQRLALSFFLSFFCGPAAEPSVERLR